MLLLLIPSGAHAQFQPLVGIPNVDPNNLDFNTYINTLYALSISLAGLLAVIKIIIAGVKYMLSDVVTSKAEAKSDIQGALIGLLVVVAAVIILNQINPQLTQTNIFIQTVDRPASQAPGQTGGPSGAPMPPPVTPPANLPTAQREIACNQNSSGTADCTAAAATCTGGGGRVMPESSFTSTPNDITCSYGTNRGLNCETIVNPATHYVEADCTAAIASCNAPSIYTQLGAFNGQCFTPY